MKKFTLNTAAIILASFVWTACIDDSVSPGVEAIRNSTAALLNAKAELELANAAFRTAEAAYKAAQTAGLLIDNKTAEQTLLEKVASTALAVAQYNTSLKKEEETMAKAINALAEYIAKYKPGLASTYLTSYKTEIELLDDLYTSKANAQALLDNAKLLLEAGSQQSFDLLKVEFQRDLARKQVLLTTAQDQLKVEEGVLAALEAVKANPATTQTALNTARATLLDLKNKKLQLDIDDAAAAKAQTDATAKETATQKTIADYNTAVLNLATVAAKITAKETEIVTLTIATTDAAIANVGAVKTAAENVEVAKKDLDAQSDPNWLATKTAELTAAQTALANAIAQETVVRTTAKALAQDEYDAAVATATTTAASNLAKAIADLPTKIAAATTAANIAKANAQTAYDAEVAKQTALAAAAVVTAQSNYNTGKTAQIAMAASNVATAQTAYNTVLANATGVLNADVITKKEAYDLKLVEETAAAAKKVVDETKTLTDLTTDPTTGLTALTTKLTTDKAAQTAAITALGTAKTNDDAALLAKTTAQTAVTTAVNTTNTSRNAFISKHAERAALITAYVNARNENNAIQTQVAPAVVYSAEAKTIATANVTAAQTALINADVALGDDLAFANNTTYTTAALAADGGGMNGAVSYTYANGVTATNSGLQKTYVDNLTISTSGTAAVAAAGNNPKNPALAKSSIQLNLESKNATQSSTGSILTTAQTLVNSYSVGIPATGIIPTDEANIVDKNEQIATQTAKKDAAVAANTTTNIALLSTVLTAKANWDAAIAVALPANILLDNVIRAGNTISVVTAKNNLTAANTANNETAILLLSVFTDPTTGLQVLLTKANNANTAAAVALLGPVGTAGTVLNLKAALDAAIIAATTAGIEAATPVKEAQKAVDDATVLNTTAAILQSSTVVTKAAALVTATTQATAAWIASSEVSPSFIDTKQKAVVTAQALVTNVPASIQSLKATLDSRNATLADAIAAAKNAAQIALNTAKGLDNPTLANSLSDLMKQKSDYTDDKARLEAANTAAILSLEADKAAVVVATNAKTISAAAITLNTSSQGTFTALINSMVAFLPNTANTTGINADIEAKKLDVETRKVTVETATRTVATATTRIATNDIDKAKATAILLDLTADITAIDVRIAAGLALAAKWKALMDAALAG